MNILATEEEPNESKITFTDKEEKRNYMANFTKIKQKLRCTIIHTLQDGINTHIRGLVIEAIRSV